MRIALLVFSPISRLVCRAKRVLLARGIPRAGASPIPVISVGNISFGGSGKTPLAIEIAAGLLARGERPAQVSRGYKGTGEKRGGFVSDGRKILCAWKEAGDEPFLIASRLPGAGVFVGKDRLASCRRAAGLGFTCAILDDGFQHLRLARDIDVVLFDPREKRALREGVSSLERARFILIRRDGSPACLDKYESLFPGAVVTGFRTEAEGFLSRDRKEKLPPDAFRGRSVFAFCGIAGPGRFFALLEECGARIAGRLAFPDHFAYPEKALVRIAAAARVAGAEALVTTEKDAIKIPPASPLADFPVYFLRIGASLEPAFRDAVPAALDKARAKRAGRP